MEKQIIHYIAIPNITSPNLFAEQIHETRTTITVKIIDLDFSPKTGSTGRFTHEFTGEEAHLRDVFVGQVRKYRKGNFRDNEIGAGNTYILRDSFATRKLRARARKFKAQPMGATLTLTFPRRADLHSERDYQAYAARPKAWLKRLSDNGIAASYDCMPSNVWEITAYDDHNETKRAYLVSKGFKEAK